MVVVGPFCKNFKCVAVVVFKLKFNRFQTHFFQNTEFRKHTEHSDLANEIEAYILYNRLVEKILKSFVGKRIKKEHRQKAHVKKKHRSNNSKFG